ncbi:unnamed protein product [Nyctereutes procyonoides]|uniref:(raccoon dog) hypothetical protein n=1 Tax=Nyctereutes procyonoides TaxID=34880 RepID=A0A811Z7I6_NYCPR|nr:unnamed protein product [Nyctereutes procyonoides]
MFLETPGAAAKFLMTEPEKSQPVLSIVFYQPRLKGSGKRSLLSTEVVAKTLQPSLCTLEALGRCLARRYTLAKIPLLPLPADHPRCFTVWAPWNGMPSSWHLASLQKSHSIASTVITSLPELSGRNLKPISQVGESQSPITQRAAFEKRDTGYCLGQDLLGKVETIPAVHSIKHQIMGPDKCTLPWALYYPQCLAHHRLSVTMFITQGEMNVEPRVFI